MFCAHCGTQVPSGSSACPSCGAAVETTAVAPQGATGLQGYRSPPKQLSTVDPTAKSKMVAAMLGVFLGGFGVHRFYLGYTKLGVIQLLLTIVTCGLGGLWGLVEGILIIAGSAITTDAGGRPLRD